MAEGGGWPNDPNATAYQVLAILLTAVVVIFVGLHFPDYAYDTTSEGSLEIGMSRVVTGGVYLAALGVLVGALRARRSRRPQERDDVPLCAHCVRPVRVGVHFCPRCSRPQTVFGATADYENVYAQAWVIGKALRYPRRRLQVIGIALFTAPLLLGLPAMLVVSALGLQFEGVSVGYDWNDYLVWACVAVYAYALAMLYCWRNWRDYRRDPEGAPSESDYGVRPWWTFDRWWTLPSTDSDSDSDSDT